MKKKKELTIKINFSNRFLYTFIVLGILAMVAVGVYAYGTSTPSNFGHSAGEIVLGNFTHDFSVQGLMKIETTSVYINMGCTADQWGAIRRCYTYAVGESLESLCVCARNTVHSPSWAYYPIVDFTG